MPANPDVAAAEFVLQPGIGPYNVGAPVVADGLRVDVARAAPSPRLRLGRQGFLQLPAAAWVGIDDRNISGPATVLLDLGRSEGAVHQFVEVVDPPAVRCRQRNCRLSRGEAEAGRQLGGMPPSAASMCIL